MHIRREKLARDLLRRAGLPVKPVAPAGVAQIAAIQRILPDYQIQCYTARGGSLIYRGPKASRKIYLILDELKQHYHVVRPPRVKGRKDLLQTAV